MNLHPLKVPEVVAVNLEPAHAHTYEYTQFHPTPVSKLRLGKTVTVTLGEQVLTEKVLDLRTRFLPRTVKRGLNHLRQQRAAVKMAHQALEEVEIDTISAQLH